MKQEEQNCKNCTKRYPACQDTCPDKSTGNWFKKDSKDKEYYIYKAVRYANKIKKRSK